MRRFRRTRKVLKFPFKVAGKAVKLVFEIIEEIFELLTGWDI